MRAEHADSARLNDLSVRVIGCALAGLNTLSAEFLEKVYENALAQELRDVGLAVAQQCSVRVHYYGAPWSVSSVRTRWSRT